MAAAAVPAAGEDAQELGPRDLASVLSSRMVGSTIMDSTSGSASVVSSRLVGSAVMDSSGSSASVVSSLMVDSVNVDRSASVMMELMESETICNYIIIIIATSPHSSRL